MNFRKSISFSIFVLLAIIGFYLIVLVNVFYQQDLSNIQKYVTELGSIFYYSFIQSSLSATATIAVAFILSKSLYSIKFKGKFIILKILSLTFLLPTILIIFSFIAIYGNDGYINNFFRWLDINIYINVYGLLGIVITHMFFNIGYCSNILYRDLSNIPSEQRKLADLLNLSGWLKFKILDFTYCKSNLINLWLLVFILSFNSFSIVLFMGGGPKYSTLEVSIFQALSFELNIPKAATFAIVQISFNFILLLLNGSFQSSIQRYEFITSSYNNIITLRKKIVYISVLIICLLFILSPLLYMILIGLYYLFIQDFKYDFIDLWNASFNSLFIGIVAAIISVSLACSLLYGLRWLEILKKTKISNILINLTLISISISAIVLSLGLFLLLRPYEINSYHLIIIVAIANALSALPFTIRYLQVDFQRSTANWKISEQLRLSWWRRFIYIEFPYFRYSLVSAFIFSLIISLGDFSIIALFGSSDFNTLPYLLSSQLGGFHRNDGHITALFLLIFIILLQGISIKYDKIR